MKKLFMLSQLVLVCGALGLTGVSNAQEEEEEAIQARPNPTKSMKATAAKSSTKMKAGAIATTKSASQLSAQRPEGAAQLDAGDAAAQVQPGGIVNE